MLVVTAAAAFPPNNPARYALPRPEGQRCLVVSARGATAARLRNGALLERFASRLPAGGPGQGGGEDNFCILDCVYHAADHTYYVMGAPSLLAFCVFPCVYLEALRPRCRALLCCPLLPRDAASCMASRLPVFSGELRRRRLRPPTKRPPLCGPSAQT